jgi:PPOX class probable F420-dependent enzyme
MAQMPADPRPHPAQPAGSARSDPLHDFLELRLIATLGTLNEDGSILLTPIWYLFDEGRLYVGTSSTSRKVRNVQARPRATLLVDQRALGGNRWVSASGKAEVVRGDPAAAINARIRARYLTEAGEEAYGPALVAADDVAIALTPESWKSWQPRLLAQTAAARGLPIERAREWFLPQD